MQEKIKKLVRWIRETAEPAHGLLVPVSGGSDSALCFWLCSQTFPEKTVAVHAGTDLRAKKWFARTGTIEYIDTPGEYTEREEMRWARFLSMSLARGFWLVGSRNRTEHELGTYSLASRTATYLPLAGIWKSEVVEMCADVGVPDDIIASSLRADPDCGRPDELAEIPYVSVELFLKAGRSAPLSEAQIEYLSDVHRRNAFKKHLPARGPH